jgi:hypothetical protein
MGNAKNTESVEVIILFFCFLLLANAVKKKIANDS